MKLDSDHELSPQAIAALRDLLQEPPPCDDDTSDEQLKAFILGATAGEARASIVSALVHSPGLRSRLTKLHTELASAHGREGAPDRAVDPPLDEANAKGIAHALGTDRSLTGWNLQPEWSKRDDPAIASVLHATLNAIGRSLQVFLATPRYAAMRRAAASSSSDLPEGVVATLLSEIEEDGTLVVEADFISNDAGDHAAEGRQIWLELLDPAGGSLSVATASIENMAATFRLEEFGTLLGLQPLALPGDIFRVVFDPAGPQAIRPLFIIARIEGEAVAIPMREATLWERGCLILNLDIPDRLLSLHASSTLEISADVEGRNVVLASDALSSFAGRRSIQLEASEGGEQRPVCGSLLRARVLPPYRLT